MYILSVPRQLQGSLDLLLLCSLRMRGENPPDIDMPDISGFDIAEKLNSDSRDTLIILPINLIVLHILDNSLLSWRYLGNVLKYFVNLTTYNIYECRLLYFDFIASAYIYWNDI